MKPLRRCVIERLPRYYHFVERLIADEGQATVSSSRLGEPLGVDDTLVRHDLAAIGVRGQPKVGYRCQEILDAIRTVLGYDRPVPAVLIGAGHLGTALASYPGFAERGLSVVGVFDNDPARIGQPTGGVRVQPADALPAVVAEHQVRLAILTVPASAAQAVADQLIGLGVDTIWNFSPCTLAVPERVVVRNELLSVGLAEVTYAIHKRERSDA